VRLQSVDTYFDPLEMFRQIAPGGVVNKVVVDPNQPVSDSEGEGEVEGKKGAVVVPTGSEEVRAAHEEMSNVTPAECPFLNRE
jgi:hypothetical protein